MARSPAFLPSAFRKISRTCVRREIVGSVLIRHLKLTCGTPQKSALISRDRSWNLLGFLSFEHPFPKFAHFMPRTKRLNLDPGNRPARNPAHLLHTIFLEV